MMTPEWNVCEIGGDAQGARPEARAVQVGCDAGVRGLLAMITSASTDVERLKLFECATAEGGAGGYFTSVQGQEIIDLCCKTARMDVYDMCKRLATSMASPLDCVKMLGANLREDQQLALRCELGAPVWRVAVGSVTGHYAFDLGHARDRVLLQKLLGRSLGEQAACRRGACADVSQHGTSSGLFRNVRLNRVPYQGKRPLDLAELPATGYLSFDVVSMDRPKKNDRPLTPPRFAGLLAVLRAAEWVVGADPPARRPTPRVAEAGPRTRRSNAAATPPPARRPTPRASADAL